MPIKARAFNREGSRVAAENADRGDLRRDALCDFYRVQGAFGSFFVLEICEDVAILGQVLPDSADHGVALLRCVGRLAKAVVTKVGGDYVGNSALLGFRDAEGNVVAAQGFVSLVSEPRWMAEFESGVKALRQAV